MTNFRVSLLFLGLLSVVAATCNCGSNSCCGSQCYNPSSYSCPTDSVTGNPTLCTVGSSACNGACYNPTQYTCNAGSLVQGATPTSTTTAAPVATTSASSSSSTTCQAMFAQLQCRTTSEDPTQVSASAVANTRSWLCGNYGQFCTAISSGGAYASCNSVEQLSYAMSQYYAAYSSQGSSACAFGGLGVLIPTTASTCQTMFAGLSCRTASEDPTQVSATAVASSRAWLCSTYPQYCTQIITGGQYASCNTVEQLSYAMSLYYNAYISQGASACSFGGIGNVVASIATTPAVAPVATSAVAPVATTSAASNCASMFSGLTCRTTSEDPTQMSTTAVASSRAWLCSTYPKYCTQIITGGQYASCNTVEQLSYAMNLYYADFASQGSSACSFGGVGVLVGNAATTAAAATTATPVVAPVTPSPNTFPTQTADLRIINNCKSTLYFEARYGGEGAALPGQTSTTTQALPGGYVDYVIPDTGLSGTRFWAKYGCDTTGRNCLIGDQMQYWPNPPGGCPAAGCSPPVDSLFEATWGCRPGASCNAQNPTTWFDTSQVDGWTIPYKLTPVGDVSGCDCVGSSCGFAGIDASTLDVAKCPSGENLVTSGQSTVNVLGTTVSLNSVDLRIKNNGSILGCMSPCKRLNWGTPYGLQQGESSGSALWMCCPTPLANDCTAANGCVTPTACRAGPIENTQYVAAVHSMAPGVYAYSYDDGVGLHACPAGVTKYTMEFCPSGSSAYPGKY